MTGHIQQSDQQKSDDNGLQTERGSEWDRGWRTLLSAFAAMGTGWSFTNISASVFMKPMQADFGWSRSELSFGPMAGLLVALLLPAIAWLIDRVGPRRVAIVGLLGIACAFCLFASIPRSHLFFYIAVACLGITGAACSQVVLSRGIAPWFERNLGAAIGLMMSGATVSAALVIPLLSLVIASYGWRAGFITLACLTLTIGLPLVTLWFREPDALPSGRSNANLVRDPWRKIAADPAFWRLLVASALGAIPVGGFIAHLLPLLSDGGLSLAAVAGFASIFAIGVGVGRIVTGMLLDRFHPPLVSAVTLFLAAGGAIIFCLFDISALSWGVLAMAIALIGLAQGAEGDYVKFFAMRLFGLGNFARTVAIMSMVISIGIALGGLIFARVFDETASYRSAIAVGILLYTLSGLAMLTIKMRQPLGSAQAALRGRDALATDH